jgi:hypothetical protein
VIVGSGVSVAGGVVLLGLGVVVGSGAIVGVAGRGVAMNPHDCRKTRREARNKMRRIIFKIFYSSNNLIEAITDITSADIDSL